MIKNQDGFSTHAVIILIVVIAVVGLTGWKVLQNDRPSANNTAAKTAQKTDGPAKANDLPAKDTSRIALTGGLTLNFPDSFKIAKQSTAPFQPTVTSSVECVERVILIPSDETYENSDQFSINIDVCAHDRMKNARTWYIQDIQDASDLEGEKTDLTINGFSTFKYTDSSAEETREYYAIVNGDYGIIVGGSFFSGDHYSFKNSKDYTVFRSTLKEIAESVTN